MKKILILAACALMMVSCSKTSVFAEQAKALQDFAAQVANVKSLDDLKALLPDFLAKLNPPAEENAEAAAPAEPTAEETAALEEAQNGVLAALQQTGIFTDSIDVADNVKKVFGDLNWEEAKNYLLKLIEPAAEEAPAPEAK